MTKLTTAECKQLHAILQPGKCWHEIVRCEWDNYDGYESYCSCGRGPYNSYHMREKNELFGLCRNPTYDNPAIIADLLRKQGIWDEFVLWSKDKSVELYPLNEYPGYDYAKSLLDFAKILTDPGELSRTVIAWDKERSTGRAIVTETTELPVKED